MDLYIFSSFGSFLLLAKPWVVTQMTLARALCKLWGPSPNILERNLSFRAYLSVSTQHMKLLHLEIEKTAVWGVSSTLGGSRSKFRVETQISYGNHRLKTFPEGFDSEYSKLDSGGPGES